MSPEELGRPTYTARPAVPRRTAEPPQLREETAAQGRRPRRAKAAVPQDSPPQPPEPVFPRASSGKKPPKRQEPEAARKKTKKQEPEAQDVRTVYVPVVVRNRLGYGIWRAVRFVALALIWLVRTMVKIALSAFVHA